MGFRIRKCFSREWLSLEKRDGRLRGQWVRDPAGATEFKVQPSPDYIAQFAEGEATRIEPAMA